MGDLLRKGSNWLEAQRKAHLATTVRYFRGEAFVDVLATVGRTVFEQADEYGIVHRTETRDFLITAADLTFGDGPVTPKEGDRIHDFSVPGTNNIYEVMTPGGEPPFRYSDPYRTTLRVHTKHVAQLALETNEP